MKLLISLSDKTEDFIHGMEFGRIWERMCKGDNPVMNDGFPLRMENKNVAIRACKSYGYTPVFGDEENGWIPFMAVKNVSSLN